MVRIAVIGAGASGLVAVKTCLEYGYNVQCFEKCADFGGLWRYKPDECDGEATVMRSTIMNGSKEVGAFSDFPPPPEFAVFMHHRQALEYLRMYVEKFRVLEHVEFNMEVISVTKANDYSETGRWMVTVKDLRTGQVSDEIFDGVMLCTGHHWCPNEPQFPGLQDGKFKGRVMHSHSYKDDRDFADKTVIVVGCGSSACDVAVELSRTARQVYLVTRNGTWMWHRIWDNGLPYDMMMMTHRHDYLTKLSPFLVQLLWERKLQQRFDIETYGLKPDHHCLEQFVAVSDELPMRIASGTLVIKPNIEKFSDDKKCVFEDGTMVDNVDVVILATGYKIELPYLEPGVIPVDDNRVSLYKHMYDPNLDHPQTLAAICMIDVISPVFPISEMQSRVFCEYIQRKHNRILPSRQRMLAENSERKKNERYPSFVPYMTELASMIDARPLPAYKYLLQGEPKLAWTLAFGTCFPYEFRLRGPHAWDGAKDAILNAWERIKIPTMTRKLEKKQHKASTMLKYFDKTIVIRFLFVIILLVFYQLYFVQG